MSNTQNIGLMVTRDEEDVIGEVMEVNKKYFDKILVLDGSFHEFELKKQGSLFRRWLRAHRYITW